MKKILLVSCLIFFQFLAGCGSNENKQNDGKISEQTKQELKEKAEQNDKNIQENKKTPEQIQAEKEKAEQMKQAESEKKAAERAEREKNFLANNYNEIYKWCYWMFYKIGYSDDALQYHLGNGDAESMRDLNFLMNKFSNDLDSGQYSINSNIPDNIRDIMLNAKKNLQKSFMLRKNVNYSEIQQSDDLQYQVIQQLIEIQSMLPEGVKYYSYDGIYDANDELDIPSEYKNNGKVTGQTQNDDDDRDYFYIEQDGMVYGQIGPNLYDND